MRSQLIAGLVAWWPGPWSLAGDLVAAPRWPLPGGRSGRAGDLVAGVCDPVTWATNVCAGLTIRALVAVVPGPWPAPWWPGRVPAGVLAVVSTH